MVSGGPEEDDGHCTDDGEDCGGCDDGHQVIPISPIVSLEVTFDLICVKLFEAIDGLNDVFIGGKLVVTDSVTDEICSIVVLSQLLGLELELTSFGVICVMLAVVV